jgi:uncharacterized phage protein (TIGR01671 family)
MGMREILFRGKRTSTGEWVYGGILKTFHPNYEHNSEDDFLKQVPNCYCICTGGKDIFVEQESICQFTGLTDKKGKRIFEGDIVRILGNQDVEDWKNVDYTALIAFIDGGFCAIDGTVEEHGFRRYALARLDFSLEVIGNIHDNPELVVGADNE